MASSLKLFQKRAKLVEPHALLATTSVPARPVVLASDSGLQNASPVRVINSSKEIRVKTAV